MALFNDVRQEKPSKILLSLTAEGILKQPGFTDYERSLLKSFALENLHGQKSMKFYFALHLLEKYFMFKENEKNQIQI